MKGSITISTHNGSTVQLGHNRRDPKLIEKENKLWAATHPGELRIDLSKEHEIWQDGNVKEIYHELFDDSAAEYNQRQIAMGHTERCIHDYYNSLKAKEGTRKMAKHPLYEIIYQVGSGKNPVEPQTAKAILKEIASGFEQRNPNLRVVGIYYHADESDIHSQHVHLTYIPVAYHCTRGMQVQNALKQALKEQGFKDEGRKNTCQMQWERRENDELEAICNRYGYEVMHPQRGQNVKHLSVEAYKLQQEIAALRQELERTKKLPFQRVSIKQGRLDELLELEQKYEKLRPLIKSAEKDSVAAANAFAAYDKAYQGLQAEKEMLQDIINKAANDKMDQANTDAINFIKAAGMLEQYQSFIIRQLNFEVKKQIRQGLDQ